MKLICYFAFIPLSFLFAVSQKEAHLSVALDEATQLVNQATSSPDWQEQTNLLNQAVEIYQQCLSAQPNNGGIHYNLGNCYFLLGKAEYAILSYRRALNALPHDARVMRNLQVTRRQVTQLFQSSPESRAFATLLFFHDFGKSEKDLILQTALLFLFLSLLIQLKWKHLGFKYLSLVSLLVSAAFITSLTLHREKNGGVVLVEGTFAHQGNGYNFEKAFENALPPGTEFELIEKRSNWLKVKFADSSTAWVNQEGVGSDEGIN